MYTAMVQQIQREWFTPPNLRSTERHSDEDERHLTEPATQHRTSRLANRISPGREMVAKANWAWPNRDGRVDAATELCSSQAPDGAGASEIKLHQRLNRLQSVASHSRA